MKPKRNAFFSTRKFKYGAAATVFTAFFIAAVILLNVIVTAIDSKVRLYFDLTDHQLFTIGSETKEFIKEQFSYYKELTGENPEIKIEFFEAEDLLRENEQKRWVVEMAESYSENFPEITVEYHDDLTLHPEHYRAYIEKYDTDFNKSSIIISNQSVSGSAVLSSFDQCLVYDTEGSYVWAFQGEMKFNAAIIKLTSQKSPVAAFTVGHGESAPLGLRQMLENSGFDVRDIDLSKEEIADDVKILIMVNPLKDITASDNDAVITEYTKISDYLNAYRSMMLIMSPSTPELPVLDELLENWGMKVVRNQIVTDDYMGHAGNKQSIYAQYNNEAESSAAVITQSVTRLSAPPRALCVNNAPIEILDSGDVSASFVCESVLNSSDNSYVEVVTEEGTAIKKGPFSLMAIASRHTIQNNLDVYGHLLVIGSSYFTETETFREQFANTDIVRNAIRLLSDERVGVDVNYKVLEDYTIAVDTKTVYTYGIITAIVIPALFFALGTVVYIKRKHM